MPDDPDDDRPKRKPRRETDDRGPRVATRDGPPVVMLLALFGGAVAMLATCVGVG